MEHENMKFKYLLIFMLYTTTLLKSNPSLAQASGYCTYPGGNNTGDYVRHYSFGNVLVSYDTPNGAVLATATVDRPMSYKCNANPNPPGGYEAMAMVSLWESSIPGVASVAAGNYYKGLGLRISNAETGAIISPGGNLVPFAPPNPTTKPIEGTVPLKIELIKVDDNIYNSSLPRNATAPLSIYIRSRPDGKYGAAQWNLTWKEPVGKLIVMPNTCTVTTPSVDVKLPPVAASQLNTVGMTAGDAGFNIGLNCKSGSNVYVTLTDLTDQGNTGNQLTLTPDSSAKGVKLRILRNGQPVGYGPDSIAIGNTNQWLVGPSATTTSIPLSAQYIATGPVSGGKVKGVATFTMSYQ
ncbi:fimbrial protein [Burkholderia sp. AU28863]|nr:fimbrial protein [Burkholderia sp. AU28863]